MFENIKDIFFYGVLLLQALFAYLFIKIKLCFLKITKKKLPSCFYISEKDLIQILFNNSLIKEPKHYHSFSIEDLSENRGLASIIQRINIQLNDLTKIHIILKFSKGNSFREILKSIKGQSYREVLFFDNFKCNIKELPKIYYSTYSSFTGQYIILMEDLSSSSYGLNYFFGNKIWPFPNEFLEFKNNKLFSSSSELIQLDLLEKIIDFSAKLHSKYWNDSSLLKMKWLKSADFYLGKNKILWEGSINIAKDSFLSYKKKKDQALNSFKINDKLHLIIENSFKMTNWGNLQKTLSNKKIPFTLTHGDFHASNALLQIKQKNFNDEINLIFLDWTEFGIWEPMTDLGQFMISDVLPEIRKKFEIQIIKRYYEKLKRNSVIVEYEQIWELYEKGGVERFLWIFCILISMKLPPGLIEFFEKQILSFIEDHGDYKYYIMKPIVVL